RWWYKMRGKEEMLNKIGAGHRMVEPDDPQAGPEPNTMWALKDVSFTVNKGEIVGIIGKNGAGKSTLLKLLTRITEPTSGEAIMRGRVASLLEVGTGFHGELTGRENIYLNGAILGMKKKEIDNKFDEIVEFSGVEKFIDTPVKRYSSGMYVRLAFAVAAHLEPEILLVDEVLAVGDVEFQKKCLGKMKEVAGSGRTVLFVSHNMAAIENLCDYGMVLVDGTNAYTGKTPDAIDFYLKTFSKGNTQDLSKLKDRQGQGDIRITKIELEDHFGNKNIPFAIGSKLRFHIFYKAKKSVLNPHVIIGVYDSMNTSVTRFDTDIVGGLPPILPQKGQIICSTESANLGSGRYYLNIALFSNGIMEDYLVGVHSFDITDSDYLGTGKTFDAKMIKVLLKHKWELIDKNG
ncbi:MAG: ABC transporter ATP-binding protein, partial [Candidatus Altiarchaeales archaeon HGW-Altiarchaeales-1]